MTLHVRASDVPLTEITVVEGKPCPPGLRMRRLSVGSEALVLELAVGRGYRAPPHSHDHESIIYMLEGRLRIHTEEDEWLEVSAGDSAVQPAGTIHFAEAVTDARWVEFKATANDDFLTTSA